MNPITHVLVGWAVAEAPERLTIRERALITAGGVLPDVDGFGALPELLTRSTSTPVFWWTDYHHLLAHNLPFSVLVAVLAGTIAKTRRALTASLTFITIHLHLLGDIVGAKGPDGYQWPIPYLYPFSRQPELTWSGQWALNAWPNIALTIVLLAWTFTLAWKRGYSPLSIVSSKADKAFVGTLRSRFPRVRRARDQ